MKVMLAALGGNPGDQATLDCALALANRFAGHVIGCHVRPDPAMMIPMLGAESTGALVAEFIRVAEEEADRQQAQAAKTFEAWLAGAGIAKAAAPQAGDAVTAEWREVTGIATETLPEIARLADIVVMARPNANTVGVHTAAIEAALFDSGRPVLLPATRGGATLGDHVAVAWNGSAQAARAVAAALPILRTARAVSIVSVAEDDGGDRGDELAAYLAWHGIAATKAPPPRAGLEIGPALVAQSLAVSADLLVMGAYGHSRVREIVFGGATQHLVQDGTLPVLMVH